MHEKPCIDQSLLSAVLEAARTQGYGRVIATDISGASLTYRKLFLRAFAIAHPLEKIIRDQTYIGVLLPTAMAPLITIISLHMLEKVPAMLNCSAGLASIRHACHITQVKTIITSRIFAKQAGLEEMLYSLGQEYKIVYLEDVRASLTFKEKMNALFYSFFPRRTLEEVLEMEADEPAIVLYTSGSEGTPKGVVLSHKNILTNIDQCHSHLNLSRDDRLFNPLPIFHSFGLTVGIFLPLLIGIRTFLYPSPLHYKQIPPLVRQFGATIFLGTDTFYQGYARTAENEDFKTVRLAVAGAEKLKESTRLLYMLRFGIDIYQGYGVTETSPVLSVNTPEDHHPGTVGRALYGITTRIEPVEGIERGGRLWVMGDNVMLGYLKADQPGVIQPQGDWYDTGDIVEIDAEGFIHILGRAKRFAKIGGEMVSLATVEEIAAHAAPESAHAAIAAPDERKGEQIVLFTESASLTREDVLRSAKTLGLSELHLPRTITYIETIPRLGNGKVAYVQLKTI